VKGAALQWGTYPSGTYSGNWYHIDVYVDSATKTYDVKRQSYPPHGSVDAGTALKSRARSCGFLAP